MLCLGLSFLWVGSGCVAPADPEPAAEDVNIPTDDLGADAEELLRFDGGHLGVVGVDIADRAQLDEIKGGAYQLLEAVQVASAHPAAADQSHTHFVHGIYPAQPGKFSISGASARPRSWSKWTSIEWA